MQYHNVGLEELAEEQVEVRRARWLANLTSTFCSQFCDVPACVKPGRSRAVNRCPCESTRPFSTPVTNLTLISSWAVYTRDNKTVVFVMDLIRQSNGCIYAT
jgi:hypothetical protein